MSQAWRDVAWYDAEECMAPIARLTLNRDNRVSFLRVGMVSVLAELMVRCPSVLSPVCVGVCVCVCVCVCVFVCLV